MNEYVLSYSKQPSDSHISEVNQEKARKVEKNSVYHQMTD